jgi:hypothetical protein
MSALTVPQFFSQSHASAADEIGQGDGGDHPATGGNPLTFVFILIGLIVAMFFLRKSSGVIQGETFGVNWFTFFQVGIMATAFILLEKAVFGRFHVFGITNAVSAV